MDKKVITLPLLVVAVTFSTIACDAAARRAEESAPASAPASHRVSVTSDTGEKKIKIIIGSTTFKVTLEENPTVTKLKSLLPLGVKMTELNGNEKYHALSTRLPTDAGQPGTIQAGDLMLYGDNTLVQFYKTFKTPYRYTRLGRVVDPSGLAAVVGAGDVTVTFQVE